MLNKFDSFFVWFFPKINNPIIKSLSLLADPKIHLILWGGLTFYIFYKRKTKILDSNIFYFFLQTGIIMFICGVLKVTLGRARPFLLEKDIVGLFYFTTKQSYLSFPSSHSSIALSFIMTLRGFFKVSYLLYLFPFCIALTRLVLMEHFATDVIFGLFIGFIVSNYLPLLLNLAKKKLRGVKTPLSML
jgi:membrane-associated phospholipid phosphatase